MPNMDIEITEKFVNGAAQVIAFIMLEVQQGAEAVPQVVDSDVREALDGLVREYKVAQSGLIYETKPVNPFAAAIHSRVKDALERLRKRLRDEHSREILGESDIVGSLVFAQRLAYLQDNGKRRGRAFLHHLMTSMRDGLKPVDAE